MRPTSELLKAFDLPRRRIVVVGSIICMLFVVMGLSVLVGHQSPVLHPIPSFHEMPRLPRAADNLSVSLRSDARILRSVGMVNEVAQPAALQHENGDVAKFESGSGDETHELLVALLSEHDSRALSEAQQGELEAMLAGLVQSASGRHLIASIFFDDQYPSAATVLYTLLLDADLKDARLIRYLVSLHSSELPPRQSFQLIDLIADLDAAPNTYESDIASFLEQAMLHAEAHVAQAAEVQWVWYMYRHQGVVPVLYGHLLTASATLRHEIYELLEMETINGDAEREEAVLALSALEHADYLSLTPKEKRRIQILKARLKTST